MAKNKDNKTIKPEHLGSQLHVNGVGVFALENTPDIIAICEKYAPEVLETQE